MVSTFEFQELLDASKAGDAAALSRLIGIMYVDLKRLAHRQVAGMGNGRTVGTTGVVHECFLRLAGDALSRVESRAHFLNLSCRIMRQIVCDHARQRLALKRGEGQPVADLDGAEAHADEIADATSLLFVDQLVTQLEATNKRWANVFQCRFFAGLSEEETAEALDLPLRTVQRDWQSGRSWLAVRMKAE